MLLNVWLPSLFAVFFPFLSSFFVQPMWWLVRFSSMSVSFCCVRCAFACISSTKARSKKREKKSSNFCNGCEYLFSLFMSSYFNEKLNVLILARVVLPMRMILWFDSSRKLWCIIIIPIFNFICMFCKKQRNNNGDCRRREKSRCYGTHIALDRASGFRSAFLQRTAKWHWLLVCIVIHSTNGFIVRNAIHFAAQKLFYFIWNGDLCRADFAAWIQWICESNGDTKSMLICQTFFSRILCRVVAILFRWISITSKHFVNCPFKLTLDRWSEKQQPWLFTFTPSDPMCKNMYFFSWVCAKNVDGGNKFSVDEKSQIPIGININSNWKININFGLVWLHTVLCTRIADNHSLSSCRIDVYCILYSHWPTP